MGIKTKSDKSTEPNLEFKNSPRLVYASLLPTCSVFPIHDYGAANVQKEFHEKVLELSYRPEDIKWVKALMEFVSKTKGVEFDLKKNKKDTIVIQTKGNSKG